MKPLSYIIWQYFLLRFLFVEKFHKSRHMNDVLGHSVAQLVEALRYKSEGRGFDPRWCHWNFSLT